MSNYHGLRSYIYKRRDYRKKCDSFIVAVREPLAVRELRELEASAKRTGGWYVRMWLNHPGGFAFDLEVVARAWAHVELG